MRQSQCFPRDGSQTRPSPRGGDPHGSRRQRCGASRGGTRASETRGRQWWSIQTGSFLVCGPAAQVTREEAEVPRDRWDGLPSLRESPQAERRDRGLQGDAASLPGTSPSGCRCTWVAEGPERDSSAWPASLSPSKANVLCSPCHSAPRLKARWSLHSGSLVPVQDKDASRQERGEPAGLTQPGGPGRQAGTRPVGHGPLLPPPAPSALCPLTPTSQETNPARGQPRGWPGKRWVLGQVREDTRGVLDSQI